MLEQYRQPVNAVLGTISQKTVMDTSADAGDLWTYQAQFTTAKEAVEGYKEFAVREA